MTRQAENSKWLLKITGKFYDKTCWQHDWCSYIMIISSPWKKPLWNKLLKWVHYFRIGSVNFRIDVFDSVSELVRTVPSMASRDPPCVISQCPRSQCPPTDLYCAKRFVAMSQQQPWRPLHLLPASNSSKTVHNIPPLFYWFPHRGDRRNSPIETSRWPIQMLFMAVFTRWLTLSAAARGRERCRKPINFGYFATKR